MDWMPLMPRSRILLMSALPSALHAQDVDLVPVDAVLLDQLVEAVRIAGLQEEPEPCPLSCIRSMRYLLRFAPQKLVVDGGLRQGLRR